MSSGDTYDRQLIDAVARGDTEVRQWSNGPHVKGPGGWQRFTKAMQAAVSERRVSLGNIHMEMRKAPQAPDTSAPLRAIIESEITRNDRGDMMISADVLKRLREERTRRVTVGRVPRTPRFLSRDAGGIGVAKGYGRLHQVSNDTLRIIRARGAVFQVIHRARDYQFRHVSRPWGGVPGTIGYRVVHKDHKEKNAVPPEGFEKYIDRFSKLLHRPAPVYGFRTLGSVLAPLEEDMLTINRPALEILHSAYDPERVVGFAPVDGNIIWPTLVFLEKWQKDNPDWDKGYATDSLTDIDAMEIASAQLNVDLFAGRHCVVREGILEAVLPNNKIIVAPMTTRTDIRYAGYPPSHVEDAIEIGTAFIHTWEYNTSLFTRGMLSEFILGVKGATDEDLDSFTDSFRESTQGVKRAHQPVLMPLDDPKGDIVKIDLKQNNREMMMEVFMSLQTAFATAIYRMDPTTVNSKPWDGGGGPQLSAPNREMEIALAKEQGLQGDMMHHTQHFLQPLAERAHPDLEIVWEFGDRNPKDDADLYEVQGRTTHTRNELRIRQGEDPLGFYLEDKIRKDLEEFDPDHEDLKRHESNLWNMPSDPAFMQQKSMEAQNDMMADMGMDEGEDEFGGGEFDAMSKAVPRPKQRKPRPPTKPRRVTVTVYDV